MPRMIVIAAIAALALLAANERPDPDRCRASLQTMDKRILTGMNDPQPSDIEDKITRMCR